jgi:hypothetical protein
VANRRRPVYVLRVRRIILVTAAILIGLALITAIAIAAEASDDVDRDSYVRANIRLLAEIPVFPGGSRLRVESEPWRIYREPFPWSYIAGYSTAATFQAPPQATPGEVARFFRSQLAGWRLASWSKIPEGWPRVLKGKKKVENRCYARGVESVCIDLIGFLVNGKIITGGQYYVSVDHRGYETRSNW